MTIGSFIQFVYIVSVSVMDIVVKSVVGGSRLEDVHGFFKAIIVVDGAGDGDGVRCNDIVVWIVSVSVER